MGEESSKGHLPINMSQVKMSLVSLAVYTPHIFGGPLDPLDLQHTTTKTTPPRMTARRTSTPMPEGINTEHSY